MKNILSVIVCVIMSNYAFAQIPKGTIVMGGSSNLGINFNNSKLKSDSGNMDLSKVSNFNISPTVGYFLFDNLATGLCLNFNESRVKPEGGSTVNNSHHTGSIFLRYHFPQSSFTPWIHTQNGFGYGKEDDYKTNIISHASGIGMDVPVAKSFVTTFALMYNYNSNKPKDNNLDNVRFINSGLSFSVGFIVVFHKKEKNN
jgi:hypothetical protein